MTVISKHGCWLVTLLLFAIGSRVAGATPPEVWIKANAETEAQKAVSEDNLYLYSSGGFVCSPKYDLEPTKEQLKQFRIEPLGCGCTKSFEAFSKSAYSRLFNNAILALVEKQSKIREKKDDLDESQQLALPIEKPPNR